MRRALSVLVVSVLFAVGCSTSDDEPTATPTTSTTTTTPTVETTSTTTLPATTTTLPFCCERAETIRLARSPWSSDYALVAVVHQLIAELGFDVNDPADGETSVEILGLRMTTGETDVWVNAWLPYNVDQVPDDSVVHRIVTGANQGLLTSRAFIDAGASSIAAIADDETLRSRADGGDSVDGDDIIEVVGCPRDWTCDDVIDEILAPFDGFVQITESYDQSIADAIEGLREGRPVIVYTWRPSTYGRLLDEALGPDGWGWLDDMTEPGARWEPQTINTVVSDQVDDEHPIIGRLLAQVDIPIEAVDLDLGEWWLGGEHSTIAHEQAAAAWIDKNRDLVDEWFALACEGYASPCPAGDPWTEP